MPDTNNLNGTNGRENGSLKIMKEVSELNDKFLNLSTEPYTYDMISNIAKHLLDRTDVRPKIGIICGSGMGRIADSLTQSQRFPYEDIPNFPVSTVEGHTGQMVFGYLDEVEIVCMQGRFHLYEGYPIWMCCVPVRVMNLLGVTHLIVTNAAGGMNPNYKVGDIMLLKDHINFVGMGGCNPLQGRNDDRFGPRFPPMNRAYDRSLINKAKKVAKELNMDSMVREGVYACIGGPNYETIAELRLLKTLGADSVGMSTAHEVITAKHCNMTVMAFSLITNMCITDYDCEDEADHEEVMDTGKKQEAVLVKFVTKLISNIDQSIKTDQEE